MLYYRADARQQLGAKYVFKYTTKGPDRAMVSAEIEGQEGGRDEIENYKVRVH